MAAWFIDPTKNEGYPMLDVWPPEWQTNFTSTDDIRYPDYMWRIEAGINEDYPWIYPWFKKSSSDSGDMEHGGSQTNYPDGFTYSDDGGLNDQFNDDIMPENTDLLNDTVQSVVRALSGKMFYLSNLDIQNLIHAMNNVSFWDAAKQSILANVYGANIYDGIQLCKMYPFALQITGSTYVMDTPVIYGIYELQDSEDMPLQFCSNPKIIQAFEMGNISPNVMQAWELEKTQFSIYLPFAGEFPITIYDGSQLDLKLYVDVLSGVGEYVLRQNGQIVNSFKCQIGIDFPIRTADGAVMSNMFGSVVNTVTPILTTAATVAFPEAAGAFSAVGNSAGSLVGNTVTPSAPQIGGLASYHSYPRARLIARIPKMFNGGYGYSQTRGLNRSTTYVRLNSCSGYTKTMNYKCDVIVATTEEKNEIENLLNAGVFL